MYEIHPKSDKDYSNFILTKECLETISDNQIVRILKVQPNLSDTCTFISDYQLGLLISIHYQNWDVA